MTYNLPKGKKIYFASDFHLGAPTHAKSLEREKKIVRWLTSIQHDAEIVFLVGDLFDFWFEYKHVVPKGFVRFFGKLAEMSDAGIKIIVFSGNHDMWMNDYLTKEIGVEMHREPQRYLFNNKKIYVGHGDGLGPGDYGYKVLKRVFESKLSRFLFGRLLHANLGIFLGTAWAGHSWKSHEKENDVYHFESPEKEILFSYAKEIEATEHHDYYIFGHRHYLLQLPLSATSTYFNLGDWVFFDSFATFDGEALTLHQFEK